VSNGRRAKVSFPCLELGRTKGTFLFMANDSLLFVDRKRNRIEKMRMIFDNFGLYQLGDQQIRGSHSDGRSRLSR